MSSKVPGRVMALDVGDVRTGVAMSDPLQIIASPHEVVASTDRDSALERIASIVGELEPVEIVVGVPLNREGQPGLQAEKVLEFVASLRRRVTVPVVTLDERFSTVSAERTLIAAGARRKKRKQVIDKVAATHILETYLRQRQLARERADQG